MIKEVIGNKLYFAKLKETAKIPTKLDENMGYDIYACFDEYEDYIIIEPHKTTMIPTGICSACNEGYAIVLKERGSTGTKGIAQRSGVIDSGYRNEWFVPLTNTNNDPIIIIKKEFLEQIKDYKYLSGERFNKKYGNTSINISNKVRHFIDNMNIDEYIKYPYEKAICQAVILPVPKMDVEELSVTELQQIPSKRGMGNIGSSGK